jgi:hypothetical protein
MKENLLETEVKIENNWKVHLVSVNTLIINVLLNSPLNMQLTQKMLLYLSSGLVSKNRNKLQACRTSKKKKKKKKKMGCR